MPTVTGNQQEETLSVRSDWHMLEDYDFHLP